MENKTDERNARLNALPWVEQLCSGLGIEKKREEEIQRFCTKFSLLREDVHMENISDPPFVKLSVFFPFQFAERKLDLEIWNQIYSDVHLDDEEQESYISTLDASDFSGEKQLIAAKLAEIFQGKVVVVHNFTNEKAWLDVDIDTDSIQVGGYHTLKHIEDC